MELSCIKAMLSIGWSASLLHRKDLRITMRAGREVSALVFVGRTKHFSYRSNMMYLRKLKRKCNLKKF
jgi:hypothetical protein